MATARFKVTMHRGPAMRTRVAFPLYAFGRNKSACLPPVLEGSHRFFRRSNSLMEYIIVCTSFAILIYTGARLSTLIWQDMLATMRSERVVIDPQIAQNEKVYNFLMQSAQYNYNHNALAYALADLNTAYAINPSGYEVNYQLANTLGAYCQQSGQFCELAEKYFDYLKNSYCMDEDWIARRAFSLGQLKAN